MESVAMHHFVSSSVETSRRFADDVDDEWVAPPITQATECRV